MLRIIISIISITATLTAYSQTMLLSTSSSDYQLTTEFSDVRFFNIEIEIDEPLARGAYSNPNLISIRYQVNGTLVAGTPSGFESFDLQRTLGGDEFYAQGSSLSFEIAQNAVLTDGVQADELVGNTIILSFNAREVNTGRFHPPLFELYRAGSGRIENTNNVPTLEPLVDVGFGEEYITTLLFDPGNITLITEKPEPPEDDKDHDNGVYVSCFIATAAYGSPFGPELTLLRKFRDNWLLPYRPGQVFVAWYYRNSPPIADYIAERDWLRALTRTSLMPLVYSIKYPFYALLIIALVAIGLIRITHRNTQ